MTTSARKEILTEAPCSAVHQLGITAPKVPSFHITWKDKSLQEPPAETSRPDVGFEVHSQWASDAWVALTRSFVRYPGSHPRFSQDQRNEFVDIYATRSREGTAIKWLKFHTSYVFAYALGQVELPAPPGALLPKERAGRPIGGSLGRILQNVMERGKGGSWPYRRCAYDILMSKLGDPAALDAFVQSSLIDHQKALSKVAEVESTEEEKTLRQVESMIAVICEDVFGSKTFRHRDTIPSIRACQENGLANAGGLGELLIGFDETQPTSCVLEPDTLFAMMEVGGVIRELRFIDMSYRTSLFQDYVDNLWLKRLKEPLDSTPVPICEPLKIRIITKGQAAEYYRCMELQKFMHGALRGQPVFQCIGHPIEQQDWARTFRSRAELEADEFYVSGDYKAATDNLRPDLSEFAWKCIASNASMYYDRKVKLAFTPYFDLGTKALTGHVLHYASGNVKQSWGQLMGSPMSFPILCIVNAAATLVALGQEYGPESRLRVNGDDIAFIANPQTYARWKEVTHLCGLDFSLGKNYCSREFIIMNSELRRSPMKVTAVSVDREMGLEEDSEGIWRPKIEFEAQLKPWKFEGFASQCLLYNSIKKGMDAGKQKDTYWTDLSSISHEMLRGIPPQDQWRLYGIFMKTYRSQICEAPALANKWFPKSLGGMGLKLPDSGAAPNGFLDTCPEVLVKQQKVAAYLACNPAARMQRASLRRPLFGPLNALFKDIRSLSDDQVPPILCKKLRNRECTPILGSSTMLGYILGSSCLAGWSPGRDGRTLRRLPLGGGRQEGASDAHAGVVGQLRKAYQKWLGDKSWQHSLSPMNIENIFGYQEHLEMVSHIERVHEGATRRSMD